MPPSAIFACSKIGANFNVTIDGKIAGGNPACYKASGAGRAKQGTAQDTEGR
jgi:hypothetical protein